MAKTKKKPGQGNVYSIGLDAETSGTKLLVPEAFSLKVSGGECNFKTNDIEFQEVDGNKLNIEEISYESISSNLEAVETLTKLLNLTVRNFNLVRDFLGLQLDHSLGNITDEFFNGEKENYFNHFDKISDSDLVEYLDAMLVYIEGQVDSDLLCGIFNVSEDTLNKAFDKLRNRYELEDGSSS